MTNAYKAGDVHVAIKSGDCDMVATLIKSNPMFLNMTTPFGTWLHDAAGLGQFEIVKKLIELGSDVNALGGVYGGNCLNTAATEGHLNIVKYLRACGAEMDVSDPVRNPLFGAIIGGHEDVVHYLIGEGIDFRVKYSGESMKEMDAYAFAIERGERSIASYLATCKASSED